MSKTPHGDILVVEDNMANLKFLIENLKDSGYIVRPANDGELALRSVKAKQPALILLDIKMPGLNGYEVCRRLKNSESTRDIPVIFISAGINPMDKIKAFEVGGVDYITKPFELGEVLARVATHLALWKTHKEINEKNLQLQQEITERKLVEETLRESQKLNETLLKQVEEKLEEKESLIQSIMDNAPLLISAKDLKGNVILANKKFEDIEGPEEFVGKNIFDLFHKDIAHELWKNDQAAIDGPVESEEQISHRDGVLHTHLTVKFPIYDKDGKAFATGAISPDITERKKIEAELQQAKKAAENANQAKSTFLANMSHELRTPLNAILGFSQLLAQNLSSKQLDHLNIIKHSGQHLLTLINQALDFSQIEAGQFKIHLEMIDPRIIFSELKKMFALTMADKGLEFKLELDETLPPTLELDGNRLRQILLNLIGNAVKFTEQGYIKLSVRCSKKDNDIVDLIFTVADTGIGIPKNQQNKIFEAFQQMAGQSTKKYGGTGLGLAITKQFVDMMNGHISIQSQVGIGSVFKITLQDVKVLNVAIAVKKDDHFARTAEIIGSLQGARILLVEDNAINQQLAREIMENKGIVVEIANNGKEAVTTVANADFDAVLMDVQMPKMDGYEATQLIRKNPRYSKLPIIAMTAYAMSDDRKKCLAVGMNDYIVKPIDVDQLFIVLGKWIKPKERIVPLPSTTGADETWYEVLPGFEIDSALRRLGGNRKLFKKLLKEFYRDYQNAALLLRAALDKKDLETAINLNHTLKGLAGNLSANQLHKATYELDIALRQACWDDILMDNFEKALLQVLKSIQNLGAETEEISTTPLDISVLTPLLIELAALIRKQSIKVENVLNSLKTQLTEVRFAEDLKQLEACLDKYDFEGAQIPLNVIAGALGVKFDK